METEKAKIDYKAIRFGLALGHAAMDPASVPDFLTPGTFEAVELPTECFLHSGLTEFRLPSAVPGKEEVSIGCFCFKEDVLVLIKVLRCFLKQVDCACFSTFTNNCCMGVHII